MHHLKWILLIVVTAIFFQNCSESSLNLPTTLPKEEVKSDSLEIVQQPASQTVWTNQPAEFSVSVSDETDVTYQWYFGNLQIAGANGPTLSIPNARPEDIGQYYVVILRNGKEELTSQPGDLVVNSPVLGNMKLVVATGSNGVNPDVDVVLASCEAGETKVTNLTVQNLSSGDRNEGGPGFVDIALCEKNGVLNGTVKLEMGQCSAGFNSAASFNYFNTNIGGDNEIGGGYTPEVTLHICDQNDSLGANIAITLGEDKANKNNTQPTPSACPTGFSAINSATFQNTGNSEDRSEASKFVTLQLCGK